MSDTGKSSSGLLVVALVSKSHRNDPVIPGKHVAHHPLPTAYPTKLAHASFFSLHHPVSVVENRCLDAFFVALGQMGEGMPWYASTLQLQRTSLGFCTACREFRKLRLLLDETTPATVRSPRGPNEPRPTTRSRGEGSSRVPRLRPLRVVCQAEAATVLKRSIVHSLGGLPSLEIRRCKKSLARAVWPENLKSLRLSIDQPIAGYRWPESLQVLDFAGCNFNHPLVGLPKNLRKLTLGLTSYNQAIVGVDFPNGLLEIDFGIDFNQPLVGVIWPKSLRQLDLGYAFNQTLVGVLWPASLREIELRSAFNQPIVDVGWPKELRVIRFGSYFNQPIAGVRWPTHVTTIDLGSFNHPIANVKWPSNLQELDIGTGFNHPVTDVVWPASLLKIGLGHAFNQTIAGVKWPENMKKLQLGGNFKHSIDGVEWPRCLDDLELRVDAGDKVMLPVSLGRLRLWWRNNKPMSEVSFTWPSLHTLVLESDVSIAGIAWPPRLRRLYLSEFNQPIAEVKWPDTLKHIRFGRLFNQPLIGVKWPVMLSSIYFRSDFNQPLVGVDWPNTLEDMSMCGCFNQPISSVKWPEGLKYVAFLRGFDQPLSAVEWPMKLEKIILGGKFNQPIDGVKWPSSLLTLSFHGDFNHPIDRVKWPSSLLELEFDGAFNQPIDGVKWPENLRKLTLGGAFSHTRGAVGVTRPPFLKVFRHGHMLLM